MLHGMNASPKDSGAGVGPSIANVGDDVGIVWFLTLSVFIVFVDVRIG